MANPLRGVPKAVGKVLALAGQPVTLREVTNVYTATTGKNTPRTWDYALTGVRGRYRLDQIDGTIVQRGDVPFSIAAQTVTDKGAPVPSTAHKLVIDSEVWSIVRVDTEYAGQSAHTYHVQCRR